MVRGDVVLGEAYGVEPIAERRPVVLAGVPGPLLPPIGVPPGLEDFPEFAEGVLVLWDYGGPLEPNGSCGPPPGALESNGSRGPPLALPVPDAGPLEPNGSWEPSVKDVNAMEVTTTPESLFPDKDSGVSWLGAAGAAGAAAPRE